MVCGWLGGVGEEVEGVLEQEEKRGGGKVGIGMDKVFNARCVGRWVDG